jgi:apolipoprotein N-acyltransferase
MFGIIPIVDAILGGMRQLEDRWNMHVMHEIFGFSLFLITISWISVGMFFGHYLPQFLVLLALQFVIPAIGFISGYEEDFKVYLVRKGIALIVVCWIMTDAVYNFCYC